jgi:hypothetical protein
MFRIQLQIILFLFFAGFDALAQLSPGDLAQPHAKLEGMSNCTQCHVLGSSVSNDKCLACHKEIKTRVDARKGYHASKEVKGKDCASCHSDHHGRNFNMVRFEEKNFNHGLTGYDLTGAHKKIECRDCHKSDFIADAKLKSNKKTYLGLGQQCLGCHEDYHQKTLSSDCAKCHNTDAFSPASRFDHDKTDYPLAGQHKTVSCAECHQKETRNGKEFQRFSGIPFANCNSCHADPHRNQLGTNCKECHVEQGFNSQVGLNRFNHSKTPFPLKGKHKQTNCAECHNLDLAVTAIFQDRSGVKTQDCATCHQDVHEGKFGTTCADCHNETSFRQVGNLEGFNHDRTDFPLEGRHEAVDCRKCHTSGSYTAPLVHNACAACHEDYHEGQFVVNNKGPDCAGCHTVDGFAGSTFSLEQHEKTKFPLTGAHVATPCFSCHLQEEGKWSFRNIGERCVDCHDDVHKGSLAEKWYPAQSCDGCHQTESWRRVDAFDHGLTAFALSGRHAEQACSACHLRDDANPYGRFVGLQQQCQACHEDSHGGQFLVEGVTDCARCHGFNGWEIAAFNHDETRFKLEGKHAEVACEGCHKPEPFNGDVFVKYRLERFECVDCHK